MHETLIEQGWRTKPSVGFNELVGPVWARREDSGDTWLNGFVVEPRHLNFHGQLHGGMMATFADFVSGRAVVNAVKPRQCATIQLNMHYVAPVKLHDFVVGRAEIVRMTRSIAFVASRFTVGSSVAAMADGVWKILNKSSHGGGDADYADAQT